MLKFDKKKRDTALTVRLNSETVNQLRQLAEKHEVSQADILERLIEIAHADLKKKKSST
jgi:predicted transcriptional regulator